MYSVTFESKVRKTQAHELAQEMGYNLVKKRAPRPTPESPILYRALCELKIREGKAFSKKSVGVVRENEHVIVNRIRSHRNRLRARLVDDNNEERGWVSLLSKKGEKWLERV